MAEIGLLIIMIAWVIQYFERKSSLSIIFVTFYSFGVLLLIVDGMRNNLTNLAILNTFVLIAAVAVLLKNKHSSPKN